MIAPARVAAYDVLRAVGRGQSDLPSALARARTKLADERDRALAGEIAAGTLRWQRACDAIVTTFTGRAASKLDPEVLDVLRLSIFQLLHLDRVPASAAVNDAVQLARKAGKKSASGLVNAVLRRVGRERGHLPLPPRPDDVHDTAAVRAYLSVTLSHPEWLVERWLDRYGFEAAEAWARFDNEPARLTLRANTLRTDREAVRLALAANGVETEPTRFAPHGLTVRSGNPLLTPVAGEGMFLVQDEASQLVGVFADARPGERVLDACASPGGKTTQLAGGAGAGGLIVASDVRGRRVELLAQTVRSAGSDRIRIVRADVTVALPFRNSFDLVLLDAPCSGLGTLRRDPDIRWRRTAADLPVLSNIQLSMLLRTADVVRPGGRLVYSTCSSEPEENERVIARFLDVRPDFSAGGAGAFPGPVQPFLDGGSVFRTFPFRDRLEAFFAAMLVKTKDLR